VKLEGKVAMVTGTSPNIGAGIAGGLAAEGARVVCVDVDAANARECAAWIVSQGGQALGLTCDVTDEAQVQEAVARAREAYGGIDVLVNNAGILGGLSVLEMPVERWTRQLSVNLTGTFLCTKHVARLMVERGTRGSIIVIVSTAGHQGQPGNIGYCTSKSGLLNFTRAAATDVEEGLARAEVWGRPRAERRPRLLDFAKMIPTGALPSPRHYARAAVFLASDDAEMITGMDLRVDAGAIAKYWPWVPSA
jgi:NAD(P)-dependent dehydrogenase (short-subunit alcohol dehydrogenase family)